MADDDINVERGDQDVGTRGGAAAYAQQGVYARPSERAVSAVEAMPNVRWSSIWAGFVTAFGTQLILMSLVVAILVTVGRGTANPTALGILTAAIAFVALIAGGYVTGRMAMAGSTGGVLHALFLWGLIVTLGTLATAIGATNVLSGTLGTAAGGITRSASVGTAWWVFITIAAALIGTLIGGSAGGSMSDRVNPDQRNV